MHAAGRAVEDVKERGGGGAREGCINEIPGGGLTFRRMHTVLVSLPLILISSTLASR